MRSASRWLSVILAMLLLFAAGAAQARIVAILYDDSGSMKGKDNLPAFGAQLLVSTLDGRRGRDKLITARMSDFFSDKKASVREKNITTSVLQRNLISRIRKLWRHTGKGTPHQQIAWLLQSIIQMQEKNEEAFLIILTDGIFNNPPDSREFRRMLQELKRQQKGPLRVIFVLIGPDALAEDYNGMRVSEAVERQGVRRALLETFNGDANDGRVDVRTAGELVEAFRGIIAHVASTEISSIEKYVRRSGREIEINSPLSIRRIISVSIGNANAPLPQPVSQSFRAAQAFSLEAAMAHADSIPGWNGQKLKSRATHFLFNPPLPAGKKYVLRYDQPTANVLLLFQTSVRLYMDLVDAAGHRFLAGRNNTVHIPFRKKVFVRMTVRDADGSGKPRVVSLKEFRSPVEFQAHAVWDRGQDEKLNRAKTKQPLFLFPTNRKGRGVLEGMMLVKGFVRAYAPAQKFAVVNSKAKLGLDIRPLETCQSCAPDEMQLSLVPGKKQRIFAEVVVSAQAPMSGGELSIEAEGKPLHVRLLNASGKPFRGRTKLRKGINQLRLKLAAEGNAKDLLHYRDEGIPIVVKAFAMGPLNGQAERRVILRLRVPEPKLVVTGNTRHPAGKAPLKVGMDDLNKGKTGIYFTLYDALSAPEPDEFKISTGSAFLDFLMPMQIEMQGDRGVAHLSSRSLCGCILQFFSGKQKIQITWRDHSALQTAHAESPLIIDIPFLWSGVIECLKILLGLLLLVYLIIAIIFWLSASTFPRRSGLKVKSGRDLPRTVDFPSPWRNWTLLKALLWPVFNTPNQEIKKEGLHFIARRGGVYVDLRKSDKDVELSDGKIKDIIGERDSMLQDVRGKIKRKKPLLEPMSWGDEYHYRISRRSKQKVTLVRDVGKSS